MSGIEKIKSTFLLGMDGWPVSTRVIDVMWTHALQFYNSSLLWTSLIATDHLGHSNFSRLSLAEYKVAFDEGKI